MRWLLSMGMVGQKRSFCYVDDMIEILIRFMDIVSGFVGPVNLGNTCKLIKSELAKTSGLASEIVYHPLLSDDPKMRSP